MPKKSLYLPIVVVLIYTMAQLVCLCVFGYTPYPDSEGYIYLAKESIAAGTFYPVNLTDIPFLWNIGAINAVALSLYIFNSVTPLLVVYSIMQGLMAWLVYAIVHEVFNRKIALISLFFFVCYPAGYACGTSVNSEVPFIFFSLLALYLCLKNKYLAGGVCFAISNYCRPMAMVFILALLFYMFFKRVNYHKYLYLLIGFFALSTFVGLTNYVAKGKYFTQGAMGWMGLMQYSWDNDTDRVNDSCMFEGNDPNKIDDELGFDCLQRDSVWRSHFFLWLKNNKIEYFKQMPEKVVKTYISDNVNFCAFLPQKTEREYMYDEISMQTLKKDFPDWTFVQILTVINLGYYYLLLALSLCGVVQEVRNGHLLKILVPLSTIVIGTAVLMFVGHGEARFHQPFMPMFIMLAACFISKFIHILPFVHRNIFFDQKKVFSLQ